MFMVLCGFWFCVLGIATIVVVLVLDARKVQDDAHVILSWLSQDEDTDCEVLAAIDAAVAEREATFVPPYEERLEYLEGYQDW